MPEPLSAEQEAKDQELAARITARSADAILEMARRLVTTTDDTLFGDNEVRHTSNVICYYQKRNTQAAPPQEAEA